MNGPGMNNCALLSRQAHMASPLGPITLVEEEGRLTRMSWGRATEATSDHRSGSSPLLDQAQAQLDEYFQGLRNNFDLPLAPHGTAFQQKVWQQLQKIPSGETRTYSEVAEAMGRRSAVRAVATACASNHLAVVVPCHRVVHKGGNATGYRWGTHRKEQLLQKEAVAR